MSFRAMPRVWSSVVTTIVGGISLLGAGPRRAVGQEAPELGHRVALAVALGIATQRDERASPVSYSGRGPSLELDYAHRTARSMVEVELGATYTPATSRITAGHRPREDQLAARLRAAYLRRIGEPSRDGVAWFLGATLFGDVFGQDHYYGGPGHTDARSGIAIAALAPTAMAERRFRGGRSITARIGVPVVGLLWRTDLDFDFEERIGGPELVSLERLREAEGSLRLAQRLDRRATLALTYRVLALSYRDPQRYACLRHTLGASISVALGGRGT